jgi:RimJ/RimL family protein N-acetyltransferase
MQLNNSYKLRGFNRRNFSDVEAVNLMMFHPAVMKAKGYWETNFNYTKRADLLEVDRKWFRHAQKLTRRYRDVLFAVADSLDQIVGWVWFYRDATHPLPKRVCTEYGITPSNSRIYQVSYEKLMSENWPKALLKKAVHVSLDHLQAERRGVIVEGLKLSLNRIGRMFRGLYLRKRMLVIYAYTDLNNLASQKVLEKNGFLRCSRLYKYDGLVNNLWIKIL